MTMVLVDGDLKDKLGKTWISVHGYAVHGNDVSVHRWVVEQAIGRKLKPTEHVHHVNYNKLDNRRSNLIVCSNSYHQLLHARQDCQNDGYNPNTHRYCTSCREYHTKDKFPKSKNTWDGYHNICRIANNLARVGKGYGKFTWKESMQQQFRRAKKKGLVSCLDQEGKCL